MDGIAELSRAYRCLHCRRIYQIRSAAERHAVHCYRNPNRVPVEGELTRATWGLDDQNSVSPGFGAWHPGRLGMCYVDGEWHAVPGYEVKRVPVETFEVEPLFTDYKPADSWPEAGSLDEDAQVISLNDARPFDHCTKAERVKIMRLYLRSEHKEGLPCAR